MVTVMLLDCRNQGPMNKSFLDSYSSVPSQGYSPYNGNPYTGLNMPQQQVFAPHRASDPGSYSRLRQNPDDTIDLSQYDVFARNSANRVLMQDVIKPEEAMPWVGSQQNGTHLRQLPQSQQWIASSYASTEPLPKHDIYSEPDSGYRSQLATAGPSTQHNLGWGKQELERNHQTYYMSVPGRNESTDTKSTVSDSRAIAGTKDPRKKVQLGPCSVCGRALKNPSDAKKHQLTHTKPFCCTVPKCGRKEGFATDNDLQRHRKSVHNLQPTVGSAVGYICAACKVQDGGKRKFWPRRDNFKAHIKRKHENCDEESLIENSKQTMRPDDARTVEDDARTIRSAIQSAANHSQADAEEFHSYQRSHDSPELSRHMSDQSSYPSNSWAAMYNPEHNLVDMHGHTADMQYNSSHTSSNGQPIGSDGIGETESLSNAASCIGYPANANNNNNSSTYPFSPAPKRLKLNDFENSGLNIHPQEHARQTYLPVPEITNVSISSSRSPSAVNFSPPEEGEYECQSCHKKKKRECDLKKHMKRHTRPYGCTFPECQRKFGSRNDWRRHETSQHFLQEMWKCQRKRLDGTDCASRPFHSVERLQRHLRGVDHGMVDGSELEAECKQFCIGRGAHKRFWCGFCEKLVEPVDDLQSPFDERFKHIGDHFDKDGRDSNDWICINENKAKKYITLEDRKGPRRRTRNNHRDDAAVEEDLPEYDLGLSTCTATAVQAPNLFTNGNILYPSLKLKHDDDAVDADVEWP